MSGDEEEVKGLPRQIFIGRTGASRTPPRWGVAMQAYFWIATPNVGLLCPKNNQDVSFAEWQKQVDVQ
jgi:hypothetical protein